MCHRARQRIYNPVNIKNKSVASIHGPKGKGEAAQVVPHPCGIIKHMQSVCFVGSVFCGSGAGSCIADREKLSKIML